MREKQALDRFGQKLAQRCAHSLFILTIFSRKKSEAVGLEVNQRVPDNQRSAIRWMIKCYFAADRAFYFDDLQITDGRVLASFPQLPRFRVRKCLPVRKNWNRKPLRVADSRAVMIGVGHDYPG